MHCVSNLRITLRITVFGKKYFCRSIFDGVQFLQIFDYCKLGLIYIRVQLGGQVVGIILQLLGFFYLLLSFVLSCPLSLLLPGHGSCCVYCFAYFLFSLSPVPNQELLAHRKCCVCHGQLFIKSLSDHYSVDFLGKGRVFQFESLFSVSTLLYAS